MTVRGEEDGHETPISLDQIKAQRAGLGWYDMIKHVNILDQHTFYYNNQRKYQCESVTNTTL